MQITRKFYICQVLLIFIFLTDCGYAQISKLEQVNSNQNEPINQSTPEKVEKQTAEKSDGTCDFSEFNTLKEMPGAFISLPNPPHPKKAKKISGDVQVRVLVNREGLAENACKVKGNDILGESAVKAAMQLKISGEYTQKRLNAKNKDYLEFVITYKFRK